MKYLANLKVRSKLMLILLVTVITMLTISAVGLYTAVDLSSKAMETNNLIVLPLSDLTDLTSLYGKIRASLRDLAVESADVDKNAAIEQIKQYPKLRVYIDSYHSSLVDGGVTSGPEYDDIKMIQENIDGYTNLLNQAITAYQNGDNALLLDIIYNQLTAYRTAIETNIDLLTVINIEQANDGLSLATSQRTSSIITILITAIISLILLVALILIITSAITKPVSRLVSIADDVVDGKLNVNISRVSNDELGDLTEAFGHVVNTLKHLLSDIDTMALRHEEGDLDVLIDFSKYKGSYKDVAVGVNGMTASYVNMLYDIFNVLGSYGSGDFHATLKPYKGKKAMANTEMSKLSSNLQAINNEIQAIAVAGIEGQLSKRSDTSRFQGDWVKILDSLNDVLNSVMLPITESTNVLVEMSKGNLNVQVTGNYKGDFAIIKNSLNSTITSLSSYIDEISDVLGQLSSGNLRQKITREYLGHFVAIKEAINQICSTLNKTMAEINAGAEQVAAGAKQISTSSMTLAEGATEQASSIQELTATVDTINVATQANASNAAAARDLSEKSIQNAQHGNDEMHHMLSSMDGIKEASNNISKIIKTIDDIAFQTNLLALNAAVEAARAGEHGKGFAVVAEEVRNLASRSQKAAQETTTLIETSISRVNEGTQIAGSTANSLETIVSDANAISQIISEITRSSTEQAESIDQMSIGLNQIAQVVQNNSATSEESASAAQELSSQSEILTQMVAFFSLD